MTEAELLFTERLDCERVSLYLNKDKSLTKDDSNFVSSVLKRRIFGEPIQYILGKTEFMGLEFKVNRDVFIPRPETEVLVETALRLVSQFASLPVCQLLDIGTGSGCIAVSLAKYLSNCNITATDLSPQALNIARGNARLNKVKVNFLESDLFSNYGLWTMDYGLIISNPPYIPTQEIDKLQSEIQYEPRLALDGGKDGLSLYRRIINDAPGYMKKDGFLIMEIGFGQGEAIKNIFENSLNFKIIEVVKDYNAVDRLIVAQWIS